MEPFYGSRHGCEALSNVPVVYERTNCVLARRTPRGAPRACQASWIRALRKSRPNDFRLSAPEESGARSRQRLEPVHCAVRDSSCRPSDHMQPARSTCQVASRSMSASWLHPTRPRAVARSSHAASLRRPAPSSCAVNTSTPRRRHAAGMARRTCPSRSKAILTASGPAHAGAAAEATRLPAPRRLRLHGAAGQSLRQMPADEGLQTVCYSTSGMAFQYASEPRPFSSRGAPGGCHAP